MQPQSHEHWPFPWPQDRIAHYTAHRINTPIHIDGNLDKACWQQAPKSPRFSDLISGGRTIHDTHAAVLWDDDALYVGYWIEEPFLEATLTERDSPIYENNDIELFIAGPDAYYEFEINALGTIYEVFYVWEEAYERAGYSQIPEFARNVPGVDVFDGVGFRPHPRGKRIGYSNWDFPGLKHAVQLNGTLNQHIDRDRGWTVELALPWAGMRWLAMPDQRALPPKDQEVWRMDFSRFNQYKEAPPAQDSSGWVWSPHGVWDSHVPELFTHIHFSTQTHP